MVKCKVKKEHLGGWGTSYFMSSVHGSTKIGTELYYKPHRDMPPVLKYTIIEIFEGET